MPYLSALEECSRRGAIQIHVYLYFYCYYCIINTSYIFSASVEPEKITGSG